MVGLGEILGDIGLGFGVAFSLNALLYCFIGVTLGTFVGVLPGVGVMATIAMLMPLTYYLEPTIGLIMLAGIYYGAAYGGSTASILLNLPGTAQSAVICFDGYPMAKQGRAGVALFITAIASFVGSIIGLIILAAFSPPLASVAVMFGSPEYFALMLLGLLAASLLTTGAPLRALAMVALGLLLGIVGMDINSGQERYTFGISRLMDGLPLVAIALGLFGLPEVFQNIARSRGDRVIIQKVTLSSMLPTHTDWKRSWPAMVRGSGMGSFFGALPGTGGLVASFMSYTVEKRVSKDPTQFGNGAIEGISAPEAANNAAIQTAFIPTLTLGIPGDAVMALMLGVMMVHNIAPGPQLIATQPEIFWGLAASFLIGNVLLLILNLPLVGLWVRILQIPYNILFPSIVVFVCIGVYSVSYVPFDIYVVMAFGLLGYLMRVMRFEFTPLILGLILGPMMEENFRRSMQLARGDPMIFINRPISGTLIAICALLLLWAAVRLVRMRLQLAR